MEALMSWNDDLKSHFVGRPTFQIDEIVREFGMSGGDAGTVLQECLRLFEQEYGIPVGLLRASDSLTLFSQPPPTKNPLSWLFTRAAYEDSTSELNYRLKKRRRTSGEAPNQPPATLGEYVAAWAQYSGGPPDGRESLTRGLG
jgi:hypothetical protein